MPVALQIRDVPDAVRDVIAEHARREGQSVQAYLLRMVEREARVLQNAAAFHRTSGLRVPIPPELDPIDIIREGRDSGYEVDRSIVT